MKTERTKQGISLIVLVLTIIVIIILAATVIISLTNNGIIGKANEAVNEMDLKQAQTIAQAIWADVYLDNLKEPGKYDLKLEVIRRLAEQQITEDKYSINVTDKGVEISLVTSDDWITIYSGTANSQEGLQLIANYNLFASKAKYKITFELDGITRQVETIATSVETEYDEYIYGLFGIDNTGKVIGIEKEEDIANMGSLNIEIMGMAMYSSSENQTVIAIMGTESTFSIKKIETKGDLVYEGNITIEEVNEPYEFKGVDLNNSYLINATIDGVNYYAVTGQIDLLGTKALAISIDGNSIVLLDGVIGAMTLDKTVQINKIYCISENEAEITDPDEEKIHSENGFVVDDEGRLMQTPNTAYTIPQTVDGIPVTKVFIDKLSGKPTFNVPVDLGVYDRSAWSVKEIVITDRYVLDDIYELGHFDNLDLIDASECTDLQYIPLDLPVDIIVDGLTKVYSPENYSNDSIIAKYSANEFIVTNNGILCHTPSGAYTVPTSVAGKDVEGIYVDLIEGTPTFENAVGFYSYLNPISNIYDIVITTSDVWAFENIVTEYGFSGYIDLSQCGSDVVIPESLLSSSCTIYVDSTAKETLYSENSNVESR